MQATNFFKSPARVDKVKPKKSLQLLKLEEQQMAMQNQAKDVTTEMFS